MTYSKNAMDMAVSDQNSKSLANVPLTTGTNHLPEPRVLSNLFLKGHQISSILSPPIQSIQTCKSPKTMSTPIFKREEQKTN